MPPKARRYFFTRLKPKRKASVSNNYNADFESKQSVKGSNIKRNLRRTVLLKGDIKRTLRRTMLINITRIKGPDPKHAVLHYISHLKVRDMQ